MTPQGKQLTFLQSIGTGIFRWLQKVAAKSNCVKWTLYTEFFQFAPPFDPEAAAARKQRGTIYPSFAVHHQAPTPGKTRHPAFTWWDCSENKPEDPSRRHG